MHIEKSLKRELLVWVIAYSLIFAAFFLYRYIFFEYAFHSFLWPILRWLDFLIVFGISILLPMFSFGILGLATSFFTLVFAHQYLNLRGWRLISIYMLPHPLIVSLYQASRAFFYHATDTPWWGWLLYGVIAYLLLAATAYTISKLFMRVSGKPNVLSKRS
jgi:hypothetical protein